MGGRSLMDNLRLYGSPLECSDGEEMYPCQKSVLHLLDSDRPEQEQTIMSLFYI